MKRWLIEIGVGLVLLVAIWQLYSLWRGLETDNQNLGSIITQNEAAYRSELVQKEDSLLILAVRVQGLNNEVTGSKKKEQKYVALISDLKLKIQTLESSGTGVASSGADSIGEYGKVSFSGKQLIATYTGYTLYYFSSGKSFYKLSLEFDNVEVSNTLFEDVDKIWKIRTESKTPGVILRASSVIDSSIFIGLRKDLSSASPPSLPSFGLRAKLNLVMWPVDLRGTQFSQVILDGSVEGYYKYVNITWYPFSRVVSGGLVYNFELSKVLTYIF